MYVSPSFSWRPISNSKYLRMFDWTLTQCIGISTENAENTKLLHIRNSIAWSCFSERFELNWVGFGWVEGGWIVFGVGQLCKKAELHFRFWHIVWSHCHHNEWWCVTGKWPLWQMIVWSNITSDGSDHSIDGISEGVDGTSQRFAHIEEMAHWGCDITSIASLLHHSIPNMPKYHGIVCKMSIC